MNRHAGSAGAQMRMIVCSEKQIQCTVFFGCYSKKSAHDESKPPIIMCISSLIVEYHPKVYHEMFDFTKTS